MKYSSILISVIFLIYTLAACGRNAPISTPTSDASKIATIVSATLSAIPSTTIAPTQTTTPSATPSPALLGKYIAFCKVGNPHNVSGLALIEADGANLRSLQLPNEYTIPECLLSFSPNGKYLASFQDEMLSNNTIKDNLVIYDVASGEIINITYDTGRSFSWSPDGNQIIHTEPNTWNGRMVTSNTGVWFLDVLTGDDRQLFPPLTDFVIGDVSWSPDGSHLGIHRILYEALGDFGMMNTDGTQFKQWENTVGNYCWSPDGKQIVYDEVHYFLEKPSRLFISNADGSRTFTLVDRDDMIPVKPLWSPDGENIIFANNSWPLTGNIDNQSQFWVVSPKGEQLHQLDSSGINGDATWISWGPDSKRLVLSTSDTAKIYVVSLDGTQPLFLAEGIGAIWMP